MKYRITKVKDAPTFEIEHPSGEGWIEIPESEVDEFFKKRLVEIANNPRLLQKYRRGLQDVLEEELQQYAQHEFYEKGRGKFYADEIKDAEGYVERVQRESEYDPEVREAYVISDISGKEIYDEEDLWATKDDQVGTFEEVKEIFLENEKEHLKEDLEKYELKDVMEENGYRKINFDDDLIYWNY